MTDRTIPNTAVLSGWRKSSHSNADAGDCLEVLDDHLSGVPVRDSKAPNGPALVFSAHSWSCFISALRAADVPS